METETTQSDYAALEAMIDRTSLADVLSHLADICSWKTTSISENYPDSNDYIDWKNAAEALENLSSETEI